MSDQFTDLTIGSTRSEIWNQNTPGKSVVKKSRSIRDVREAMANLAAAALSRKPSAGTKPLLEDSKTEATATPSTISLASGTPSSSTSTGSSDDLVPPIGSNCRQDSYHHELYRGLHHPSRSSNLSASLDRSTTSLYQASCSSNASTSNFSSPYMSPYPGSSYSLSVDSSVRQGDTSVVPQEQSKDAQLILEGHKQWEELKTGAGRPNAPKSPSQPQPPPRQVAVVNRLPPADKTPAAMARRHQPIPGDKYHIQVFGPSSASSSASSLVDQDYINQPYHLGPKYRGRTAPSLERNVSQTSDISVRSSINQLLETGKGIVAAALLNTYVFICMGHEEREKEKGGYTDVRSAQYARACELMHLALYRISTTIPFLIEEY